MNAMSHCDPSKPSSLTSCSPTCNLIWRSVTTCRKRWKKIRLFYEILIKRFECTNHLSLDSSLKSAKNVLGIWFFFIHLQMYSKKGPASWWMLRAMLSSWASLQMAQEEKETASKRGTKNIWNKQGQALSWSDVDFYGSKKNGLVPDKVIRPGSLT